MSFSVKLPAFRPPTFSISKAVNTFSQRVGNFASLQTAKSINSFTGNVQTALAAQKLGSAAVRSLGALGASSPAFLAAKLFVNAQASQVTRFLTTSPAVQRFTGSLGLKQLGTFAGKGFGLLEKFSAGFQQASASTATTRVGRVVDVVVGGGLSSLVGGRLGAIETLASRFFPNFTTRVAGGGVGGNLGTAVRATVTLGESVFTRNTAGLNAFSVASRAGQFGSVFQGATLTGDRVAKSIAVGRVHGLPAAARALFAPAPRFNTRVATIGIRG